MHINAINNFSYKNYNCSGPCPEPKHTSFKGQDNDSVPKANIWNTLQLMALLGIPLAVVPAGCKVEANSYAEATINNTICDTCDRVVDPDTTIVVDTIPGHAWFKSPVMHARNQLFNRLGIDTTGGHVIKDLSYTDEMDYYHVKDTFNLAQSAKERLVYDRKKFILNDETGHYDIPIGESKMVYTLTEGGLLKAAEYVVDSTGEDQRVDTKFYRYNSTDEAGVPVYSSSWGTAARMYTLEQGPDESIIQVVLPSGTTYRLADVETHNEEVQIAK